MALPVLLAVDDDPEKLGIAEEELRERYSRDYTVLTELSCAAATTASSSSTTRT